MQVQCSALCASGRIAGYPSSVEIDENVLYTEDGPNQGVTKRCRLSWLTNSALVYEPKCGGRGEVANVSANENSFTQ